MVVKNLWVACSAKTGEGIDELLDTILLAAELEEIKVPKDVKGKGIVIESRKNPRMGTMATILLQEGTLSKGDSIVCGATYGKIRKLEDERNLTIVYYLHKSRSVKARFKRGLDGKEVGVFASRTPDRLSRIGIQDVRLVKVEGTTLVSRIGCY